MINVGGIEKKEEFSGKERRRKKIRFGEILIKEGYTEW